jgi:hypothetical protein
MECHLNYLNSLSIKNIKMIDIMCIKDKYQEAKDINKNIILKFNDKVYDMLVSASLIEILPFVEKSTVMFCKNSYNTTLIHNFIVEVHDNQIIKQTLLDRNINIETDNTIFNSVKQNWTSINNDVKQTVFNYIYELIGLCDIYLLNNEIIKKTKLITNKLAK